MQRNRHERDIISPELQAQLDDAYLRDNKKPIKACVLDRLEPSIFRSNGKQSAENNNCVICQEDYVEGERVLFLPCMHSFHNDCVLQHFRDKDSCPICKKEVVAS